MSNFLGLNNDTLRSRNRGLILRLIATGEGLSRIALASLTGLSKMSVTNIVSEFLSSNIVQECNKIAVKGQGRNPVSLCLSPNAPKLIGLHIFRDACTATLCDLKLTPLKAFRFTIEEGCAAQFPDRLCDAVEQVMPDNRAAVLGIGVGSIGPIDLTQGIILNPPNFYGIENLKVAALLKERFDLPVCFDSQYNCAALAEKYFGTGYDYHDFLYVGISNGIGSGIISGGEILRDQSGLTSELGHISIDWRGNPCSCGNRGCLETYAGTRIIADKLNAITGETHSFAEYCDMAQRDKNAPSWPVLFDMIDALSCALASTVNLLNPQAIVIGHDGCILPDACLHRLEQTLAAQRLVKTGSRVRVMKSAFGAGALPKSCAATLLHQIFDGKLLYTN